MGALVKAYAPLATLVGMAIAGLVGWGAVKTKVEELEALKPQVQQLQMDNAVLKEAVQDIRETVHRIEDRH